MEKIQAYIIGQSIFSNDSLAYSLYKKSSFGEPSEQKIQYTLSETLYLVEMKKIEVSYKNKKLTYEELIKKFQKIDKKIQTKYAAFKDLRKKGYVVKTALKFGAEFRVYDKGIKPGKKHAKWIVFTDHESNKISWHEFSAKNRIAHSTKKKLLLAILDEEGDITYYECSWIKP